MQEKTPDYISPGQFANSLPNKPDHIILLDPSLVRDNVQEEPRWDNSRLPGVAFQHPGFREANRISQTRMMTSSSLDSFLSFA